MRHTLRTAAGIGLIVLGVAGMLLPIMPGIPFLIAGVAVLGTDHALVRWFQRWLHERDHPLMHRFRTFLERHGIFKPHQPG